MLSLLTLPPLRKCFVFETCLGWGHLPPLTLVFPLNVPHVLSATVFHFQYNLRPVTQILLEEQQRRPYYNARALAKCGTVRCWDRSKISNTKPTEPSSRALLLRHSRTHHCILFHCSKLLLCVFLYIYCQKVVISAVVQVLSHLKAYIFSILTLPCEYVGTYHQEKNKVIIIVTIPLVFLYSVEIIERKICCERFHISWVGNVYSTSGRCQVGSLLNAV